jgi:hypothetical protein
MAFTKVLTMYQKYHTSIHPLSHSPFESELGFFHHVQKTSRIVTSKVSANIGILAGLSPCTPCSRACPSSRPCAAPGTSAHHRYFSSLRLFKSSSVSSLVKNHV